MTIYKPVNDSLLYYERVAARWVHDGLFFYDQTGWTSNYHTCKTFPTETKVRRIKKQFDDVETIPLRDVEQIIDCTYPWHYLNSQEVAKSDHNHDEYVLQALSPDDYARCRMCYNPTMFFVPVHASTQNLKIVTRVYAWCGCHSIPNPASIIIQNWFANMRRQDVDQIIDYETMQQHIANCAARNMNIKYFIEFTKRKYQHDKK